MEKFVIGLFSEQLATFIKGFNKDQVNANLLNGKGEVTDVHANVEPINEILKGYTNLIELSSVYISKLSFKVTSFRNIKTSPIEVTIDEVHIVIQESLNHQEFNWDEWPDMAKKMIEDCNRKGAYGLLERITDNLSLEINRVYVTFQSMGKYKTRKIGKWTPPALSVVLNNVHFVMVDEYGNEGAPEEVWWHNSRNGKQEAMLRHKSMGSGGDGQGQGVINDRGTFMIYKLVTMEVSIAVGYRPKGMSARDTFHGSKILVANLPVQVHMCLHRRIRHNAILAAQIDVSLMNLEVEVDSEVLPLLVHALIGIQYCLAKDRSFVDPFEGEGGDDDEEEIPVTEHVNVDVHYEHEEDDDIHENDGDDDASKSFQIHQDASKESVDVDADNDNDNDNFDTSVHIQESEESGGSGDENENENDSINLTTDNDKVGVGEKKEEEAKRPALVLPAGVIIFQKIAISLSINHIGFRLRYHSKPDRYLQTTLKGFLAELIWPQETSNKLVGHFQMSVAYANVQNMVEGDVQQLFLGGYHAVNSTIKNSETENFLEEMFPLFERSRIRSSPVDLRSTFPVQLFGLKSNIELMDEDKILSPKSKFSVINEIGINNVSLTFLADVSLELLSFVGTHFSTAFDHLDDNIHESALQQCIQPLPATTGDILQSLPDMLNVTARLCDVTLRIPPHVIDEKCGTILCALSESMFIISPSLPRMFLPEEVPSNETNGFPNATRDILDLSPLEKMQKCRVQFTISGVSLSIQPSIPLKYFISHQSQKLLYLKRFTFLASYEFSSGLTNEIVSHLFLSVLTQDVELNINFDVLASALATVLSYKGLFTSDETSFATLMDEWKPSSLVLRSSTNRLDLGFHGQNNLLEKPEGTPMDVLLLSVSIQNADFGLQLCGIGHESEKCTQSLSMDQSRVCLRGSIGQFDCIITTSGQNETSEGRLEKEIICIFGSCKEDERSINLRFDKDLDTRNHWCNIELELSSGKIFFCEQIFSTISMISEALLRPQWSQINFPGYDAGEAVDEQAHALHETSEWRLKFLSSILCNEAENIDFFNIRCQSRDINLIVPNDENVTKLAFVCDNILLHTIYSKNEHLPIICADAWEVVGYKRDYKPGFHHALSSQQRVLFLKEGFKMEKSALSGMEIVSPFSFETNFQRGGLWVSSGNFDVSVEEWNILIGLKTTLLKYKQKYLEFADGVTILTNSKIPGERNDKASPKSIVSDVLSSELQSAQKLFTQVRESLLACERQNLSAMAEKESELGSLHEKVFHNERERVAAFSLISHRMSGFLKMSGTNVINQRFVSTTNFWQYYGIIRGTDMILFDGTSQTKPLFVISLKGAKVRALTGSGAKRTFSRAFAIIEVSGEKKFFISNSFKEYERWIAVLTDVTSDLIAPDPSVDDLIDDSSSAQLGADDDNNSVLSSSKYIYDDVINGSNSRSAEIDPDGEALIQLSDSLHDEYEDDSVSQYSSSALGDGDGESNGGRRAKFRDRMSKTKDRMSKVRDAVKKNVKIDTNAIKQLNSTTFPKPRKPVFARRQHGHLSGKESGTRLKHVRESEDEPHVKEIVNLIEQGQVLCYFNGEWTVDTKVTTSMSVFDASEQELDEKDHARFSKRSIHFSINMFQEMESGDGDKTISSTISKTLPELIKFHTNISEMLVTIKNNPTIADLEITGVPEIFSLIISSGKMLRGFLGLLADENSKIGTNHLDHAGRVTSAFISALVSNPIPSAVSRIAQLFLGVTGVTINAANIPPMLFEKVSHANLSSANETIQTIPGEVFELLDKCEVAMSKTERQITRAQCLAAQTIKRDASDSYGIGIKESNTNTFTKEVMQDALLNVMKERDEMHSHLVAFRILHTHEMDQIQRKNGLLESKLKFAEQINNKDTAPAAAFFLGQETIPDLNSMTKIEKDMVQNVDDELLALCKQLSSEISSRVAAELEVIRLKESRRIEREVETTERSNLEAEIQFYKQKFEEERNRSNAVKTEKEMWQRSFEELVKNDAK